MRTCNVVDLFVLFCLAISYLPVSDAILCYQCGDSNGEKKTAPCLHDVRRLAAHRDQHQTEHKPINRLSYLKNCSHYRDNYLNERFRYCQIVTVESFGTINAFIRDCGDRNNFAAQLNLTRLQFVRADNQTTCGYSHLQLATICVRLCDTDFCNGPIASGCDVRVSLVLLLGTLVFALNFLNDRFK